MGKIAICIIARKSSSRLKNKVVLKINEKEIIQYLIERLLQSKNENIEIVLCTTKLEEDEELVDIAKRNNLKYIQGSELAVVDRIFKAAELIGADTIVRVTGDNIFTDVILMDELIRQHTLNDAEYSRYFNLPNGITTEVINRDTLQRCYKKYDKNQSEYMTLHLFNPDEFRVLNILAEDKIAEDKINLSIDNKEDFIRSEAILNHCNAYNLKEIIDFVKKNNFENTFIDTAMNVRLIDRVIPFFRYKEEQKKMLERSMKQKLIEGWYDEAFKTYFP